MVFSTGTKAWICTFIWQQWSLGGGSNQCRCLWQIRLLRRGPPAIATSRNSSKNLVDRQIRVHSVIVLRRRETIITSAAKILTYPHDVVAEMDVMSSEIGWSSNWRYFQLFKKKSFEGGSLARGGFFRLPIDSGRYNFSDVKVSWWWFLILALSLKSGISFDFFRTHHSAQVNRQHEEF